MRIPSGTTNRYIYFVAVDSTDFTTRETGLSSFTVYRSRNGGTAAAMTTPTINETDATNMPGVYELLLDEDTTLTAGNDTEELSLHITHAGMAPVTRVIELYRPETTEGNTLDVTSTGAAGIDWANVENQSTSVDLSATAINLCDTVTTNTDMRGTDNAFLAASAPTNFGDLAITATTGRVTVGTNNDKSGYSISGTITTLDALDTAQDAQHSTTQSAISGLNDPTAAAIADAVWTEAISDHSGTSGSTAEALNAAGAAGDPWTTALPGAYGAGSAGYIVGNNLDAAASTLATAAALATVDANVDAILVDTGTTLPATLATIEGKIDTVDTVADAILVDTGTTLPATLTTIEGKVDTIDGIVDAIVIDTAEIGAAGAGLTAITDAITALNDPTAAAVATAVLTTQMTESYAADGVAPTLAQAVLLIQQGLLERAVSGTTETIKKLDKSTAAATYTLDDANTPTSKTRAT